MAHSVASTRRLMADIFFFAVQVNKNRIKIFNVGPKNDGKFFVFIGYLHNRGFVDKYTIVTNVTGLLE